MEFDWDEGKARRNLSKHGVSFEFAAGIFSGPVVEHDDLKRDYGEDRIVASGVNLGRVLTVVYADRGSIRRIVSARKATKQEAHDYYTAVGIQR